MFQHDDLVAEMVKEGAQFYEKTHLHEIYHIMVPEDVYQEDHEFKFNFYNFKDACKGRVCKENVMV